MQKPRRSAVLITIAIVLITILIPILSNTEFHGGIPMEEDRYSGSGESASALDNLMKIVNGNNLWNREAQINPFQKKLTLIALPLSIVTLVIIAILLMVSSQVRKKILSILIGWGIVLFTFYMVFFYSYNRPLEDHWQAGALIESDDSIPEQVSGQESDILNLEDSNESGLSRGISYIFTFVILILAGGIIYFFYRKMQSLNTADDEISIKDVTEQALSSFGEEGLLISDIIIRCYNDMVLCLHEERGISRTDSMTAGEFKLKLLKVGLPENEVGKLTSLFERVRYGREPLSLEDEKEAELCLKSVVASLETVK